MTIEIRWATVVSAYSLTVESGRVAECSTRNITGWSDGLTFWNEGGAGIWGGSCRAVRAICDCTSCAAASMFRLKSNWSVMFVPPWELVELIDFRPAIVENCFSRGKATAAAIVSGAAPGSDALTWMVGKSTVGRSLTGNCWYAIAPNTMMPSMSRIVVTGRWMKTSEGFMVPPLWRPSLSRPSSARSSLSRSSSSCLA